MRGTLLQLPDIPSNGGIIPAYAGNTFCEKTPENTTRDHPRVCGEHLLPVVTSPFCPGSSPRMRGTLMIWAMAILSRGIIPAYAGNTRWGNWLYQMTRDHPRVCGEHLIRKLCRISGRGSSPRMRGTRVRRNVGHVQRGIIPAYAGNTEASRLGIDCLEDHPRVCGEHDAVNFLVDRHLGSSPRMRGTLTVHYLGLGYSGIIPAYAGNTSPVSQAVSWAWDHPRVCGEHNMECAY